MVYYLQFLKLQEAYFKQAVDEISWLQTLLDLAPVPPWRETNTKILAKQSKAQLIAAAM